MIVGSNNNRKVLSEKYSDRSAHHYASTAQTQTSTGTRVTEQSVTNRLFEGQLRCRVAMMPLTVTHVHLQLMTPVSVLVPMVAVC